MLKVIKKDKYFNKYLLCIIVNLIIRYDQKKRIAILFIKKKISIRYLRNIIK